MRKQMAIAVAGAVALTAVFFLLLLRPKLSDIAETRDQVEAAKQEEQTLRNRIAQLQAARDEAPAAAARLDRLAALLPAEPDLPGFIRALQRASTAAGVNLLSIAPNKPSDLSNTIGIQSVSVNVSIQGSFRRVEDFLARLENLRRVVEVRSVALTPQIDEDTGQTLLNGNMTLRMYVVAANARVGVTAPAGQPQPEATP